MSLDKLLAFNQTKVKDISGLRFGTLVVVGRVPSVGNKARWRCHCDCGRDKEITGTSLRIGMTRSCGVCTPRGPAPRHGHAGVAGHSRTYAAWCGMRDRCANPNYPGFHRYGGRGISVSAEWAASFEVFLADMGEKPPGLSLDRIDNDGDYEPGNCRWATLQEQCRNRRTNRILEHDGQRMTIAEWAERIGVLPRLIGNRISLGWSVSDALTRPVRPFKEARS